MLIIMKAKIMLAMVAIVAVAAVSIIAGVSSTAHARGQCHLNGGSYGCTGGASFFGSLENTICNKGKGCHNTGGP
jgi:hypothetical protein